MVKLSTKIFVIIILKLAFGQSDVTGLVWAGSSSWHYFQSGAMGSFTNPACLSDTLSGVVAGFTGGNFFEDMFQYVAVGIKKSSGNWGWGITLSALTGSDIPKTGLSKPDVEPSAENRPFIEKWGTHGSVLASVGTGIPFSNKISAGLSLCCRYVWIDNVKGYGAGGNFSVVWYLSDFVSLGSSVEKLDGVFCSWSDGVYEWTLPNFFLTAQFKQPSYTRTDVCATFRIGVSGRGNFMNPLAAVSTELGGVTIGIGYRNEGPGVFLETPFKAWLLAVSGVYHSSLGASFVISVGRKL